MDTPRYRIGNDLTVFWAIHNRDGSPFDMEGKEVHLYVTNERGRREEEPILTNLPDGTINNVIRWDYKGGAQRVLGLHTLTVEILESSTHREIIKDYCEAFTLVSRSEMETDEADANISIGGDLVLSSKLDIYRFEATNVDLSGIKESIHKIGLDLDKVSGEAEGIKDEVGNVKISLGRFESDLQKKAGIELVEGVENMVAEAQESLAVQVEKVEELDSKLQTKASIESVELVSENLATVNTAVEEQAVKVGSLEREISLKASSEKVEQIASNLSIASESIAEQAQKVNAIEAEVQEKASKESVDQVSESLGRVSLAVESQATQIGSLGQQISEKASAALVAEIAGDLASANESIAEQGGKIGSLETEVAGKASIGSVQEIGSSLAVIGSTVEGQTSQLRTLEASLATKVSQDLFNEKTAELNTAYSSLKETTDEIEAVVGEQKDALSQVQIGVKDLNEGIGSLEKVQEGTTSHIATLGSFAYKNALAWSEISEKPNALLFGGTSSQFLKADGSVDSNAYVPAQAFGAKDANTIYDASMLSLGGGSNLPTSSGYGSLLTMPYRKATGNTKPDFAVQIYIPNGDDTKPYLYYRTSLGNSWNAWRTVLDDGNYASYALPLTGGTITGNGQSLLVINRQDGNPVIQFQYKGAFRGALGFDEEGTPFGVINGDMIPLVHLGNIREYALPLDGDMGDKPFLIETASNISLYAKGRILLSSQANVEIESDADVLLHATDEMLVSSDGGLEIRSKAYIYLSAAGDVDIDADGLFLNGSTVITSANSEQYGSRYIKNLGNPYTDNLFDYNDEYEGGVTMLSNTSGASIGNIGVDEVVLNIGPNRRMFGRFIYAAHTNPMLYFQTTNDSNSAWGNKKTIAFTDSDITGNAATASALKTASYKYAFVNGNNVLFGYETAKNNYDTILAGRNVSLRYGLTPTIGLILNSSGNVTIGTSDLAGTDAKLYVDGKIGGVSILRFAKNTTYGIYKGNAYSAALADTDIAIYATKTILGDGGNVGIGTTNPQYKLDVNGTIVSRATDTSIRGVYAENSSGGVSLYVAASGNRGLYDATNNKWVMYTNGTNAIFPVGNIGIGISSPAYKLDVNGSGRFTETLVSEGAFIAKGGLEVYGSSPYIDFHFGNSTSDYTSRIIENASGLLSLNRILYLVNGERAGVGGTNSSYKFNVEGTTCLNGATTINGKVSASGGIDIPNGQQLAFLDASGNRHTIAWDSASNGILIDGNLIVLGELATGLPMQEVPSIPEIGV